MNPQSAAVAAEPAAEEVGTPTIDGSTLSAMDVERAAVKVAVEREVIRHAVYAVADHATDAAECRYFLDMIGIDLASVRAARESRPRS
jgi:hypothetical protein